MSKKNREVTTPPFFLFTLKPKLSVENSVQIYVYIFKKQIKT